MSAIITIVSGWAGIARYLGVHVQTARKLNGLPVRSLNPDCTRPRVYAYTAELRRWRDDRALVRRSNHQQR